MKIEQLKWDSEFFGKNIGKLEITDGNDVDPILLRTEIEVNNYDLVYIFKYNKMLSNTCLAKANLELMDIQLTMSKVFNSQEYLKYPYHLRNTISEKELYECYSIAEQTSIVSRFYNEPLIGDEMTKTLYRKWIDNSLNHEFSNGLFLHKELDQTTGIHLIKTNQDTKTGQCSLIGVSQNGKRKGVGRNLWEQAYGYWANETNIETCKVPFSLQNKESFNFHLKMGFNKIEEIKYIYHYRNTKNK